MKETDEFYMESKELYFVLYGMMNYYFCVYITHITKYTLIQMFTNILLVVRIIVIYNCCLLLRYFGTQ